MKNRIATPVGVPLVDCIRGFERSLTLRNRSPRTIDIYVRAAGYLVEFMAERGMPATAEGVSREHVEAYVEHLQAAGAAPATVANRFRSLQQFFKYLVDEDERAESPMRKMRVPFVPEQPVPVVSDEALEALLRSTAGKGFEDRRDTAIIRLFIDTGMRLSELVGVTLSDVDRARDTAMVLGKGRRPRPVPYGNTTAQAVDRYLRVRGKVSASARTDRLFIGVRGAMTDSGVRQMVWRRSTAVFGREGRLYPHQLRHTAAHRWMSAGGSETGLMAVAGWKSRQMLSRYGASAAVDRARDEHRRLGLGDKL